MISTKTRSLMKDNHTFPIIGGGIAGLTTAIALQPLGIQATVFEAAPVVTADRAAFQAVVIRCVDELVTSRSILAKPARLRIEVVLLNRLMSSRLWKGLY
jgi:glycine/D-amino acid oxidase-like deaminating enzyme